MQFQMIDPQTVEACPWNSNVVSHENEGKLRASIDRHGMFKPILVREIDTFGRLQCIGGWHRCEQAIELGYDEVPAINLGQLSDERAKEISLADNARYGIDDTLKLSDILSGLDAAAIESVMPWTRRDIDAITASLSTDIDDLDLDEPVFPDEDDAELPEVVTKPTKTHAVLRFRCTLQDSAKISNMLNEVMRAQGFTKDDELTNAGDALAFALLKEQDDD